MGIVYRFGSATDDALTPRPKDTQSESGRRPGLSVESDGPGQNQKAQKIEVDLLMGNGLAYFPDDPATGGPEGHGVIAPVLASGEIDIRLLNEWASFRGCGVRHRLTQAILDAIVERDVRIP
jgi:hypothetical protein